MIKIVPIQTGTVRIKPSQVRAVGHGAERIGNLFADPAWTPALPILAWVILHPDGVIVVDTGETSRAMDAGYYPEEHPYYKYALRVQVAPEDEIGAQLVALGIAPASVRTVYAPRLNPNRCMRSPPR